jgi:5'-3' exonuclease
MEMDRDAITFNYNKVDEFLNLLNVVNWKEKGLEADDLIAHCVSEYHNKFDRIVIASADSDLIQLLKYNNIFLRKKVKNKYLLYSRKDFKELYDGMTTSQFVDFLCLTGTHNAVPGIKGLGPKKADKIVKNSVLWNGIYSKYTEEIDLYRKLIGLPFKYGQIVKIPKLKKAEYPERKITVLLATAGITMTAQMDRALSIIGGER